jgi:hypothetical protein
MVRVRQTAVEHHLTVLSESALASREIARPRYPWATKPTRPGRLGNFSFLNVGKPLPRPSTMSGLRLPAEGGFPNDPLQGHTGP